MSTSLYRSTPLLCRGRRSLFAALTAIAVSLACESAWGHVAFDAPAPNTALVAGSEVEITWEDVIAHQTTAYHLELRTAPAVPGVPIASDLPPTQHSLTWQVPTALCDSCWLYVIQDNDGADYEAVDPISIVAGGSQPTDGGTQVSSGDTGGGGCAIAPSHSSGGASAVSWLGLAIALLLGRGMRRGRPRRLL